MGELIWLIPRAPRSPEADGRLRNPRVRLHNANLRWRRYRRWTAAWAHGACEFCRTEFSEDGEPGTLHSGYSVVLAGPAGQDDYCWICVVCFEDLRERFGWNVLEAESEPATGSRE
jgi:hypothetical protein